jgi:hypothetical protein
MDTGGSNSIDRLHLVSLRNTVNGYRVILRRG